MTSSEETVDAEVRRQPGDLEHAIDQFTVRRRCDPERPAVGQPLHGLHCAVDQRQVVRVPVEHALHDLTIDLFGRLRQTDDVVHVARPLGGAHPHHVRLRLLAPAAASFAREPFSHLVPDLLAVEDDAVEIEDDGLDHAGRKLPSRYTSPGARSRLARSTPPRLRRSCGLPHRAPRWCGTRARRARSPRAAPIFPRARRPRSTGRPAESRSVRSAGRRAPASPRASSSSRRRLGESARARTSPCRSRCRPAPVAAKGTRASRPSARNAHLRAQS